MQANILLIAAALVLPFTMGCKAKQAVPEPAQAVDSAPAAAPAAPAETAPEAVPEEAQEQQARPKLGADSIYFAMERTPCFGTCPAYRLFIKADGTAYYDGRRFAPRDGRYTGHVDAAKLKTLLDAVEQSGFYGMNDVYDAPVTDLPSLIIRVHAGDRDKQVVGRMGTPRAFKDLGARLEDLLAGVEWTKVEDEQ